MNQTNLNKSPGSLTFRSNAHVLSIFRSTYDFFSKNFQTFLKIVFKFFMSTWLSRFAHTAQIFWENMIFKKYMNLKNKNQTSIEEDNRMIFSWKNKLVWQMFCWKFMYWMLIWYRSFFINQTLIVELVIGIIIMQNKYF